MEKVLYYEAYLVTSSASSDVEGGLEIGRVISEQQYEELRQAGIDFEAGMGGETIRDVLRKLDLDTENKTYVESSKPAQLKLLELKS